MNLTHLHLILVHAPIVAPAFALVLLAFAAVRPDRGAHRAAVLVLLLGALGATGASLSGEEAEETVEHLAGVDEAAIELHEERAEVATIVSWVALAVGVAGLVVAQLTGRERAAITLTGVGTTVAFAAMAATGLSGGQIRHGAELGGPVAAGTTAGQPSYAWDDDDDDDDGRASRK